MTKHSVERVDIPAWATKLMEFRERKQMRQKDLARMVGVTQSAVAQWERGAKKPSPMAFMAIGRLAGDDRDWWFSQAGPEYHATDRTLRSYRESHFGNEAVATIPFLKDAVAAGEPMNINEREVDYEIILPRRWVPKASSVTALRVEGDSMSPILEAGYIVLIDTSDADPKKLVNKMVAARADDGVTIKWLRREKARGEDVYMLVPNHTSVRHQIRLIVSGSDSVQIVGRVVKWIGEPPAPRK